MNMKILINVSNIFYRSVTYFISLLFQTRKRIISVFCKEYNMIAALGVYILFRIIPVIFHLVGIYLLIKVKYIKRYQKIQGIYLMWLSIVEITMNLSKIAIKVTKLTDNISLAYPLDMVRTGFLCTQMLLVLAGMTADRLAFVRLNLNYKLKLAQKATKIFVSNALLFSVLVTVTMFLTLPTISNLDEMKSLYYWPISDTFITIVFVTCYVAMIKTINEKNKKLYGAESIIYQHKMRKATLVPKLIVGSYFIFWMSTSIIYLGFKLAAKEMPIWLKVILDVIVCMGYSKDAIFYIFFCHPIRRVLKKFFQKGKDDDVCVISGNRATAATTTATTTRTTSSSSSN